MRTTIDLPDDLLRRVKARAAMEGVKMKELIALYLQQGLAQTPAGPRAERRRSAVPLLPTPPGVTLPALSNREIEELLTAEEVELVGPAQYR